MSLPFHIWIVSVVSTATAGFALWIAPRLSRPTLLFGVTVSPEFARSSEAGAIVRRYQYIMLAQGIVALAAAICHAPVFLIMPLQVVGFLVAVRHAWKAARPHAVIVETAHVAIIAPHPSTPAWLWCLKVCFFIAIAACAGYLWMHWADIPETFPTHWGMDGKPNGWSNRTPAGVFWPLGMAGAVGLVIMALGSIPKWARRVDTDAESIRQHARLVLWTDVMLTISAYIVALPLALIAVTLPLRHSNDMGNLLVFALIPVVLMSFVSAILIYVIAQNRRKSPPSCVGDRTQDSNWKWGFYYAPDDPALWVEKRFGFGWTVNVGHPVGKIIAWASGIITLIALLIPLAGFFFAHENKAIPYPQWNHSFENDPALVGRWESVDYVDSIERFTPGVRSFQDELFVKELEFMPDGTTAPLHFRWSKGLVWSHDSGEVHYSIYKVGEEEYLFMEWFKGRTHDGKRDGYVMRRVKGV